MEISAGGEQLGRYHLVRKLATGAVAEVFLAKVMGPAGFEKSLVIKRINPALARNPEFVQLFLREAKVAAQLDHPNVAQLFDFGEVDGTYFLAMEFVDGLSLRGILQKQKLPLPVAARIVSGACEALACAHELADGKTQAPLGIIHGDINPDHVMVARNGGVKVIDFGISRVAHQVASSSAGTVKGTLAFMPLEQILAEADLRADVYALGVLLYEVAAGVTPYPALPEAELIDAIINTDPVPLLVRAPDVPVEYAMVVDRAIARDVDARFQNCRELAAALDDFIAGSGERVGTVQLSQLVNPAPSPSSPTAGESGGGYASRPSAVFAPPASRPSALFVPPVAPSSRPSAMIAPPESRPSGLFVPPAPPSRPSAMFAPPESRPGGLQASRPSALMAASELQPAPVPLSRPSAMFAPPESRPSGLYASRPSAVMSPVSPGAPSLQETRAEAVLAHARRMCTYDAGAALGTPAELEAIRAELERDEGVNRLVRFPQHAARLLEAHPDSTELLAERIVGAIEGLLLSESYGALARLLGRLEAGAKEGDDGRWVYQTAIAAFATPEQVTRLGARLREAAPADAEGLGRLLPLFGGELAAQWISITEAMELPGSREALLPGLAGLAGKNPAPFLARIEVKRPRRLSEFVYLLEKGRGADRQRAFREMMARPDPTRRRDVLTGLAQAGTDDAQKLLVQALADPDETLRIHVVQLLAKYFPDRAFGLIEPLLEPTRYEGRSAAERLAIWRAIGGSNQPEAYYGILDALKLKPSLLNRGKVEARKLDALEGLALMKTTQGAELLAATAVDKAQSEAVRTSARRLLTLGRELEQPRSEGGEVRRWERTPSTFRDVLLDLGALAHAARLLEVTSPLLEIAFTRLRVRLEAVLKLLPRAVVVVRGRQISLNGAVVSQGTSDPELERAAATFARSGVGGFTFSGAVPTDELQQLVRWLAQGAAADGVSTPHVERVHATGAETRPAPEPVPVPPLVDPSREAMVRYVDLIFDLRAFVAQRQTDAAARLPEARVTLHELAAAMHTRAVRFLGLCPATPGRDALLYHCANVAMLSLGFGAELGLSRERLAELAEYALYSDVGRFELSDETLQRGGALTNEEQLRVRRASQRFPFTRRGDGPGAVAWACVVVEHGLDFKDRAGVARENAEIGLLGSVVSLARTWEGLRSTLAPEVALETLHQKLSHRFRPELLPLFGRYVQRHSGRDLPRR